MGRAGTCVIPAPGLITLTVPRPYGLTTVHYIHHPLRSVTMFPSLLLTVHSGLHSVTPFIHYQLKTNLNIGYTIDPELRLVWC